MQPSRGIVLSIGQDFAGMVSAELGLDSVTKNKLASMRFRQIPCDQCGHSPRQRVPRPGLGAALWFVVGLAHQHRLASALYPDADFEQAFGSDSPRGC